MTVTPQTNTDLQTIAETLRNHDNIVICAHVSPDGDAIGSQLTLWHALRSMGKTATCILVRDEPIAASEAFMPGADQMIPAERFDGEAEVFVGVDVPTRARIEEAACAILDRCKTSITIDHHANDTTMCELVYVDPDMASASIIVWEVVKLLCEEPPMESALCAFVGLATDTGGFQFQNCDARAFVAASELVTLGVDPAEVASHAFQSRSVASVRLEERTLNRMMFFHDNEVVLSWVSRADFEELGANKSDAEPLIDSLREIGGLRVACMLREQDGMVRGSLRSKDGTNVAALAKKFGGGGHRAAAGFSLDMDLEHAIAFLEDELSALMDQQE